MRPYWTPRDISMITLLSIYATVFESTPTAVTVATTDAIHKQTDELEAAYPDSGDLNHINIKLPSYIQQINCPTRQDKILDKCYIKHQNAYYKCYKLSKIGNCDHHPIFSLVPTNRSLLHLRFK